MFLITPRNKSDLDKRQLLTGITQSDNNNFYIS